VTEDLVVYGGTCPKCFAEIPGEEAATDPGIEAREAEDRWDRIRARLPMLLGMTLLVLIVGCTGLTALAVVVWPSSEPAEVLDFDALASPMPDLLGAGDAGAPEVASTEPSGRASNHSSTPRPGSTGIKPVPKPPPGAVDLSLDAPRGHRDDNVVLTDPVAIVYMIGERMIENIPGLKTCYDRQLKVTPTLRGRWKLSFTIETSGAVSQAVAQPLDKSNAELESCLVKAVQDRWKFGKISIAQPVQRTLRFNPE